LIILPLSILKEDLILIRVESLLTGVFSINIGLMTKVKELFHLCEKRNYWEKLEYFRVEGRFVFF